MDIKDFILIGGGLLIAAVVAHGFWIAWRERRQDLRIDIKPDLIPVDEVDEIDRLRGELPNGGSRVVPRDYDDPQQDILDLEAPPSSRIEPAMSASQPVTEPIIVERIIDADYALPTRAETDASSVDDPVSPERARVADVALPEPEPEPEAEPERKTTEPIVPDEPKRPRRLGQRRSAESAAQRPVDSRQPEVRELTTAAVEELIVMNVLADAVRPFTGDELFTALRTCGLKFGDMNIFHRVEPLTKAVQYSVASAVEPGTFDMADMEAIRCPGLCLFMQLPGPEDPTAAFEDMLSVARSVTKSLGGEVRDEHRNIMTPQTVEHYRHRIVDFSRRRMSKRA